MGPLIDKLVSPVYVDTNIFIYALEGFDEFAPVLKEVFDSAERGKVKLVTSELTIAEVLVKPFSEGRIDIWDTFERAIMDSDALDVIPVNREILIEAAKLRASHLTRLPDAIHLSTAIHTHCSSILTNDKSMPRIPDLIFIYLSDYSGK